MIQALKIASKFAHGRAILPLTRGWERVRVKGQFVDVAAAIGQFRDRMAAYMLKAIKEAKQNTSWTEPNPEYESATKTFVEAVLDPSKRKFLDDFVEFQAKVSFFGRLNSLSQVLLKITSPGVPDFYQGTELWDLNLVDPDNRRPVDYALRERLLSELDRKAEAGNLPALCAELLENYQDGRIKLWTTMQALRLRRDRRDLR